LQNGKFIREIKTKSHLLEKLRLELKKSQVLNTYSESDLNLPTIPDINSNQNNVNKAN
jgi:hypothetical protein